MEKKTDKKAAVLTLDYGNGNLEFSVLYFSNDWDELEQLLMNPKSFFKKVRKDYDITTPKDIIRRTGKKVRGWDFGRGPVTGVFISATRSQAAAKKLFSFAMAEPVTDPANTAPGPPAIRAAAAAPPSVPIEEMIERTPETFMAEFAINTRTITVTYNPPTDPRKDRYPVEKLSSIVIASTDVEMGGHIYGSCHADLAPGPAMRAAFAMTYIENPARVAELLEERAHSESQESMNRADPAEPPFSCLRVSESSRMLARPTRPRSIPLPLATLKDVPMSEVKNHTFKFAEERDRNGLLIVEGLGANSGRIFGCVHCVLESGHPGEHILADMTVKNYEKSDLLQPSFVNA
jgi:hypothetical protein